MKKFTEIKGLTEQVRLTRIDKIRLGAKLSTGKGKEYPIQLPFFLLPNCVAAVHGGKISDPVARAKNLGVKTKKVLDFIKENGHRLAEELPVMIAVGDRSISFPQAYKLYGASAGLKCIGDGKDASERQGTSNNWIDKKCSCKRMKTDENPGGMTGLELAEKVVRINPMINCAVVSSLTPAEFHEASEGLGLLAQLPVRPGVAQAEDILKRLREVICLTSG